MHLPSGYLHVFQLHLHVLKDKFLQNSKKIVISINITLLDKLTCKLLYNVLFGKSSNFLKQHFNATTLNYLKCKD